MATINKDSNKHIFFCSAASRYFKEQLHGSAANYNAFILVEHSDPFPEKISHAHFNKEWIAELQELAKQKKAKLLLIRNKKSDFKNCRLLFVDCIQQKYFTIQSTITDVVNIRLADHIQNPATIWEKEPFYVVCTNGKKDKCCAKFGFPVFKFFEKFPGNINVYECTHVGGDRFAANAVCMPYGIYYGRVMVEDVENIITSTEERNIHFPNYRGISRCSFFYQSVECYLREHLADFSIDFDCSIKILEENDPSIRVEAVIKTGVTYELQLTKEIIPYPYYLTCHASKTGNITRYLLGHIKVA